MNYPFIKCLSPQWTTNRNTGERILVGCGKCVSCRNLRAQQLALKCKLESQCHKYCFFITLTYDETFVPLMVPVAIKGTKGQEHYFISTCQRLGEEGTLIIHHPYRKAQIDELNKILGTKHGIPYLSKRDIQLFMKRFRKNVAEYIKRRNYEITNTNKLLGLDKNFYKQSIEKLPTQVYGHYSEQNIFIQKPLDNENIRYFLCGEYGPKHLRPHYHLLVWVDGQEVSERMADFIAQSWKFGITDCQLVENDASSYVAHYVNSVSSLPALYQQGKCAPFALHSNFLGEKFYRNQAKEIYKLSATEFVRRSERINDSVSEFVLWRSLKNTFYPRCREYASSTPEQRKFLYTLYAEFRKRKPSHRTPSGLAQEIIENAEEQTYDYPIKIPNDDISKLSYYYDKLLGISDNHKVLTGLYQKFQACKLEDDSILLEAVENYAKHLDYCRNFIYRDLATSKHFLEFVCNASYNPVDIDCKLLMIDNFYKALDLACLNDQLHHQEVMLDDGTLSVDDLEYFYDSFDVVQLCKLSISQMYRQYVIDKARKRGKHKKQNDANRILFHEIGLI